MVVHGAPVYPGAMFLLSYIESHEQSAVLGFHSVMYNNASIFDLIVPRLLAGQHLEAADISVLGHGGFCRGCKTCHFPNCGFGK